MERFKSIIIIIGIIILIFGYSYYRYQKRNKGIKAVNEYCEKNNLIKVFYLNETNFNIFDKLLENKSQINFLLINSKSVEKKDNNKYWVQCSQWLDPQDMKTLTNFLVNRNEDNFEITILDLYGKPSDYDTLSINEIKGKIFEIIDNWIKNEYDK